MPKVKYEFIIEQAMVKFKGYKLVFSYNSSTRVVEKVVKIEHITEIYIKLVIFGNFHEIITNSY